MGKEGKIEKKETNEELKEIDEMLEKYRDVNPNLYPFSYPLTTEERELVSEFPRMITNYELSDFFYERTSLEPKGPLSNLFVKLELAEITKYNRKMADFSKERPKLLKVGVVAYRQYYDGENIAEPNVFKDYSTEEKVKILEKNKDLVNYISYFIYTIQATRLDFENGQKDTLWGDQGVKGIRDIAESVKSKDYLSGELYEEVLELYEKFRLIRGDDTFDLEKDEASKIFKKRFPTKEFWNEELERLKDSLLELGERVITEIKQKMKENYEKSKKNK